MTSASISVTRPRLVALHGGCNFRDIGGYPTQTGRTVRWGRVYRAGVLSYFTEGDHDTLHGLEVRAVCDLRRAEEREREPSAWPAGENLQRPAHLHWDDGTHTPTIRAFAANRPVTAAGMFDAMIDLYRAGRFPFDRLIKFYPLTEINEAARDALQGRVLKPVMLPG